MVVFLFKNIKKGKNFAGSKYADSGGERGENKIGTNISLL